MPTVAIIEDDIAIAQMYRIKFEAEGYDVESAENGQEGLQLIEEVKPDIVLLDLMMPVMTGEELLKELRKQDWGKKIKIIVLTNMGEQEAPVALKDLDVLRYIVKAEMTPRQVAEVVKQELEKQVSPN
jgi:DNA-binding response OmpR family regulator